MDFKGKAKAFCRTYDFLLRSCRTPTREWEKLSILLNLLIPKAARAEGGGSVQGHS